MPFKSLSEDQIPQFTKDWVGDGDSPGLSQTGSIKDLAELWGLNYKTTWRWLDRLGIRAGVKRASWTSDPDIGKVPDSVIADRYGVTKSRVHAVRKQKGIPAFRQMAKAVRKQEDPGG